MNYFQTDSISLSNPNEEEITSQYNKGFVLTRKDKGDFIQTRSLRIDLSQFVPSSENRRILNKNIDLQIEFHTLPLSDYTWEIHNLGKTFYTERFGDGTMSASKIKEMFTDSGKSNMNAVFVYRYKNSETDQPIGEGYALCYYNQYIIHYAYPFYNLKSAKENNLGMAMMLKAILYAKENGQKYIYLGSIVEKKSLYKLQFSGLEWFNTETKLWENDIEKLKSLVNSSATD
ncbi:MAG: hypothetical protein ABI721_02950 [Candidatus Dojkabacteria bacterium]